MSDRTYYVICADGCKFESMTKEQILTAIQQAISTGAITDVDTGFVTTIREKNKNAGLSFWVGTSAEYNALTTKENNCFYILTDDTIGADILAQIENTKQEVELLSQALTEYKAECDQNLTQLDQYIAGVSDQANTLEKDVYTLKEKQTTEEGKKNKTLWSGILEFDDWISGGETVNNIKDYTLVNVRVPVGETSILVLCTVTKINSASVRITGTTPIAHGGASNCWAQQACVYITLAANAFNAQQTYIIDQKSSGATITPTKITEIIGVM